jgi:hypothetical protein
MPRRKKRATEFTLATVLREENYVQTPFPSTRPDGGRASISDSRDQNSEDDDEDPGFYNVCPCCKCARRTKPSVQLHTTIDLHIQKNKISTKFEVSCIWFHLHAKV